MHECSKELEISSSLHFESKMLNFNHKDRSDFLDLFVNKKKSARCVYVNQLEQVLKI